MQSIFKHCDYFRKSRKRTPSLCCGKCGRRYCSAKLCSYHHVSKPSGRFALNLENRRCAAMCLSPPGNSAMATWRRPGPTANTKAINRTNCVRLQVPVRSEAINSVLSLSDIYSCTREYRHSSGRKTRVHGLQAPWGNLKLV